MKYIARKRYKKKCIQGEVNIPFGTELSSEKNIIYYKNRPVCFDTSQDALDYFVSNEDNQGLYRIELINWILDHTSNKIKDKNRYEKIWKMIWSNDKYYKFKRSDNDERWLWYKGFYTASIDDLQMLVDDIKTIEQGDC
jgi:hypothetical protein